MMPGHRYEARHSKPELRNGRWVSTHRVYNTQETGYLDHYTGKWTPHPGGAWHAARSRNKADGCTCSGCMEG